MIGSLILFYVIFVTFFYFVKNGTKMTKNKDHDPEAYFVERLLNDGAKVPVDQSTDFTLEVPTFYDDNLFKRAQDFYVANRFACFGGMLTGLLGLLAVPSILDVLVETKNSSNVYTAYRRYLQTIFHTINWFRYDLKPGSPSWKSLISVRKIHAMSSKRCQKAGAGFISQKDMSLTQFAFMGLITSQWKLLGVQYNKEDLDAYCHFWRVIGYMLGIKDEFNLCTDSLKTTLPRVNNIRNVIYANYLQNPTPSFIPMTKYVVDGLWCFNPGLDYDAMMYYTCLISGVPGYTYSLYSWDTLFDAPKQLARLNWYSRFILWMQIFTHTVLLNITIVRLYHNYQLLWSECLIRYFPFLAFYQFKSIRKCYVRI